MAFDKPKKRTNKVLIYKDLKEECAHIDEIAKRCIDEAPTRGMQYNTGADYDEDPVAFDTVALSKRTLIGLKDGGFENMTRIQAASIPHALGGRDILGAAKTGSGKTLSFIVPCVEHLWRQKWSAMDGLGCLIISPTRELAIQIFDVLRAVGRHHTMSAGILIGGKKEFREEQLRITSMSILVATPGRLLQHLEQTHGFDVSTLQILILDEADRILDMGFRDQLTNILGYLPDNDGKRQTMLFSATQTKSVKDLARLSLNQPEFIAVHEKTETATPTTLTQQYMVLNLKDKLDALYSFIKAHLKSKTVVFFATCSQVRFAYECFRTLQPGVPLMALHGKHKQARRTFTFMNFVSKPAAVLFATDIAARGLDFPEVDWVVQVDAPEDTAMYIHRVGRTARYNRNGKALLLLLPNEEVPFLELLNKAKVPTLKKLSMNPNLKVSIAQKAAAINASKPEIKRLASKAFSSYVRSVQMMPNKTCFDIDQLPLPEFAQSLGLGMQPSLKFLNNIKDSKGGDGDGDKGEEDNIREEHRNKKNTNKKLELLKLKIKEEKERKKRVREGKSEKVKEVVTDDLLIVKARHNADDEGSDDDDDENDEKDFLNHKKKKTKVTKMRIDIDGGDDELRLNQKVRFGDDGLTKEFIGNNKLERAEDPLLKDVEDENVLFIEKVKNRLLSTSQLDKDESKQKLRDKKNKLKWGKEDEGNGAVATLGTPGDSDSDDDDSDDDDDGDSDSDDSAGSGENDNGAESDDDAMSDDDDSDDDDSEEEVPSKPTKKTKSKKEHDLTVNEAEAAVMRMLAK